MKPLQIKFIQSAKRRIARQSVEAKRDLHYIRENVPVIA